MDAPKPVIKKVRWRFSLVWLVPIIAAAAVRTRAGAATALVVVVIAGT